ncbi:hypothetical protein AB5J72_44880 [Streptomyces sp. CG1]|uniref:hypothetical protein n=1 Tax=Streptomyces sp. CG1 TaxID=1287523 RepID=UPI0034E2B2B9
MPIFIRCLGHLWVDVKFGHFGEPGDLTEEEGPEGRIQAGLRHCDGASASEVITPSAQLIRGMDDLPDSRC